MKKIAVILSLFIMAVSLQLSAQNPDKLVSSKSHIKFFSHTVAEDIEANNVSASGVIKPAKGEVIFSVPMQGFEFEKALMQKHFNSDKFLDTKAFPKAKFKGVITNPEEVSFTEDGEYKAFIEGEMTIKGQTKKISESGLVKVKDGKVSIESSFELTLADYGITFVKGKPSTNIAKTVKVSIEANF